MRLIEEKSNVQLAKEIVPITFVCKLIGMDDVDYGSSGAKIECPFGSIWHVDGGQAKSFRIYNEVSAYCFACSESYNCVTLYSRAKDLSLEAAAELVLEAFGYVAPTAEARWEAMMNQTETVDQTSLVEALKLFCARTDPDWEIKQFDPKVSALFRKCVDLLPNVRTAGQTAQWLAAVKTAMTKVLGETS